MKRTTASSIALLFLAACSGEAAKPAGGAPGDRAVVVTTSEVKRGAIQEQTAYVAEMRARADVNLAAELSGQVVAVEVDLGDRVKKDQLLARLEDRSFRQAVREARAEVALADASVLKARVELDTARKDRDRKAPLLERGLLSKGEFEAVDARFETARTALALATAQTAQAQARLERALIDLENTRIVAPFEGVIASRNVDPGALVNPGTTLLRITDTDKLVIRFAAPERDVVRLSVGQAVNVSFDAVPEAGYQGRVERVSPVVDPETRTTPVEVVLPNDGRLKPGMFARVEVTLSSKEDAVLVPANALVRRKVAEGAAEEGVFVMKGGVARYVPVTVGIRSREILEISEGVSLGDQVITAGHANLRDGAKVRPVDGAPGAGGLEVGAASGS